MPGENEGQKVGSKGGLLSGLHSVQKLIKWFAKWVAQCPISDEMVCKAALMGWSADWVHVPNL